MAKPRIQITCPAKAGSRFGNRTTALRWQRILRQLGCRVRIVDAYQAGSCDLLIALHARKSARSILAFRKKHPASPLVVALTGTDLYRDIRSYPEVRTSLSLATRIIVLQQEALNALSPPNRRKARVIHQSVPPSTIVRPARPRELRVIVAGHLRSVKDPLRTAYAVRSLPCQSKIVVQHYGGVIDAGLEKSVRKEMKTNLRYQWHGEISRSQLRRKMATAWLMVLSSKLEGGANVLSEAIATGLPTLATSIDGSIGLLGKGYPGYFEVGNTKQLRSLLLHAEQEKSFYLQLQLQIQKRAYLFDPDLELRIWKRVLREMKIST